MGYYTKWIIKVFIDEKRSKLLFSKAYSSVKEVCEDFKGLTKNFLYDLERKKIKGFLNTNSRKSKYLEKYKLLEIWKIKKDKHNNKSIQCFSI